MTKHDPEARPTWFRLSEESWAEIARAYLGGETARALAVRWKVSPTSIYRHAGEEGWTKRRCGDAAGRAHAARTLAEAAEAQARAEEEARAAEAAAAARADEDWKGDPAAMHGGAMQAVGRALALGRPDEALRLVRVAEGLGRLAEQERTSPALRAAQEAARKQEREAERVDERFLPPGGFPRHWTPPTHAIYIKERRLEAWAEEVWPTIERCVSYMLGDSLRTAPREFLLPIARWRAEHFGPDRAAGDLLYLRKHERRTYLGPDGALRPGFRRWMCEGDGP